MSETLTSQEADSNATALAQRYLEILAATNLRAVIVLGSREEVETYVRRKFGFPTWL